MWPNTFAQAERRATGSRHRLDGVEHLGVLRIVGRDDGERAPSRATREWVGDDGPHEWGLLFDGVGISRYACAPREGRGTKGAVVVEDVFEGVYEVTTSQLAVFGSLGAALLSSLVFGALLWTRAVATNSPRRRIDSDR